MRRFSGAFVLLLLAGGPLLGAAACISGNTLASYEALGATGCNVGPLTVRDFLFSVVSSGGGATPVSDTNITVTTDIAGSTFGLIFASPGFSVSGSEFVNYLIAFTWDPSGDIRSASDILDPGLTDILTDLCVGVAFSGTSCAGTPQTLHVFEGVTNQLTDTVSFAPVAIVGVRNNISLQANGASASFNSIENTVALPEPAYSVWLAGGLMMLAARRRGRLR